MRLLTNTSTVEMAAPRGAGAELVLGHRDSVVDDERRPHRASQYVVDEVASELSEDGAAVALIRLVYDDLRSHSPKAVIASAVASCPWWCTLTLTSSAKTERARARLSHRRFEATPDRLELSASTSAG
jgi:hypothetical protein